MKRLSVRVSAFLAINVVLLLTCLFHLPNVFQRPRAPFVAVEASNGVFIEAILDSTKAGTLWAGDRLLTWMGSNVPLPEAVEFLGDLSSVGASARITIERDKSVRGTEITLIPYYPTPRFHVIIIFVGLVIWGVAIVILLQGPAALTTSTLHWAMVAFAVTILITPGAVSSQSFFSFVERLLFFLAYMGVVALFFFFTLLYPKPKSPNIRLMAATTFAPAFALVGGISYFHLTDLAQASVSNFESFQALFDVFQASLFAYIGGGILNIVHSFRRAESNEERRRLQWIIWGSTIGSVPFLFFHVLPQILFSRYLIAEEYATIFFLAIAFSYAISLVRHHFLDIEVVINRSIVYGILTLLLLATYLLVVLLFAPMLGEKGTFEEYLVVVAGTLAFVFLLNPLRMRLQRVIDETLFATRVNFRDAVTSITEGLYRSLSVDELYQNLLEGLSRQIPLGSLGVYEMEDGYLVLKGSHGARGVERIEATDSLKETLASFPVYAVKETTIQKGGVDVSHSQWLRDNGISLCSPLKDDRGELRSLLALSMRTPADRFREEEIDLVVTVCKQASGILERLWLQERVILEREERRRMQELSDLKSYFVSSVSHELRMPLTSIRMFAESLRHQKRIPERTRKEYLDIIEGESERLSRLIGNVLDFSRIERSEKEYNKEILDPAKPVRRALRAMAYEFKKAKARLKVNMAKRLPKVRVDADAFEEVVMNLLSNALKYSLKEKRVRLSLGRKEKGVVLEVFDQGMGIPREELSKVFDKFHRVRDTRARQVGGTGLGLALVKHFVDAHEGTIKVESRVGKGSVFRILLPASDEKNNPGR